MQFVLALHSHLPWVLNHGRWPHGSDWLTEAALDTYLPLLEVLRTLGREGVAAPVTIGFTPVLANQLQHPLFAREMDAYFTQRLAACAEAPVSLAGTGESHLLPVVGFWRARIERLRALWGAIGGDIIGAFRAEEDAGRIEIIGSAATHGFLPLLARDESIRLQLGLGFAEHRRIFGRDPRGCWVPECAYRPRGPWQPWPGGPRAAIRRGTDEHVADAGFGYFFVDAHLVQGGEPLSISSGEAAESVVDRPHTREGGTAASGRTPYRPYAVLSTGRGGATVLVRDPRASTQVWSRHQGYPGDGHYLEFHKLRWPGGLRLWRVSAPGTDLGAKEAYDPSAALERAAVHAEHFAALLGDISTHEGRRRGGVVAVPFDTELFGHWWFEGPDFVGDVYRKLGSAGGATPATASQYLAAHPPRSGIRLPAGSWGANGDYSMWLNDRTAWTWQRLWPLEQQFWDAAPAALADPAAHAVLAQAAREMLLAQASDWQFIISTGAVADYAARRLVGHCEAAEELIAALGAGADAIAAAGARAEELRRQDDLFPEVVPAIAAALTGTRAQTRA